MIVLLIVVSVVLVLMYRGSDIKALKTKIRVDLKEATKIKIKSTMTKYLAT